MKERRLLHMAPQQGPRSRERQPENASQSPDIASEIMKRMNALQEKMPTEVRQYEFQKEFMPITTTMDRAFLQGVYEARAEQKDVRVLHEERIDYLIYKNVETAFLETDSPSKERVEACVKQLQFAIDQGAAGTGIRHIEQIATANEQDYLALENAFAIPAEREAYKKILERVRSQKENLQEIAENRMLLSLQTLEGTDYYDRYLKTAVSTAPDGEKSAALEKIVLEASVYELKLCAEGKRAKPELAQQYVSVVLLQQNNGTKIGAISAPATDMLTKLSRSPEGIGPTVHTLENVIKIANPTMASAVLRSPTIETRPDGGVAATIEGETVVFRAKDAALKAFVEAPDGHLSPMDQVNAKAFDDAVIRYSIPYALNRQDLDKPELLPSLFGINLDDTQVTRQQKIQRYTKALHGLPRTKRGTIALLRDGFHVITQDYTIDASRAKLVGQLFRFLEDRQALAYVRSEDFYTIAKAWDSLAKAKKPVEPMTPDEARTYLQSQEGNRV